MENKYKDNASKLIEDFCSMDKDESGNRIHYDWQVNKLMCQLAEKVEKNTKKLYVDFITAMTNGTLFTREKVEELLQKQRELCAEDAETTMEHCSHSGSSYCDCQREVNKNSILNAKLKID